MKGKILSTVAGVYNVILEDITPRGKFRHLKIKPVVGDNVIIENNMISEILPRKNILIRPSIANIDLGIIVSSCEEPKYSSYLLDKFLSYLNMNNITPLIILSKIDLSNEEFINKVVEEYNKINNKISEFLANNEKQLLLNKEYNPTEYNGYTKFNKEKVYNMIIYLSDKTILKTKLLKEMFYADFLFYKENCKSITGLEYCKLPFGPVPDSFETILSYGDQEDIIDYKPVITPSKEYYEITSKKKFNKDLFTKEELEVLDKIKKYFKNYNAKEIVDYSHKEKAFIDTNKCEKISYDYSFDIDLK